MLLATDQPILDFYAGVGTIGLTIGGGIQAIADRMDTTARAIISSISVKPLLLGRAGCRGRWSWWSWMLVVMMGCLSG